MTKALIVKQGKRGARIITGLDDEDAASAMATFLGGTVLTDGDLDRGLGQFARKIPVVADVVDYREELKERGHTQKEHAERVKKRVADRERREAERAAEFEAKRRERLERDRREQVERRAQELRDQALQRELDEYRAKAQRELVDG